MASRSISPTYWSHDVFYGERQSIHADDEYTTSTKIMQVQAQSPSPDRQIRYGKGQKPMGTSLMGIVGSDDRSRMLGPQTQSTIQVI